MKNSGLPDATGLIRELPRIRRYARQNEETDYRFREYLKVRLPLSNAELDGVVTELTADVWGQIDCLTCGNCCKTLQIVVDDRDIARLARRLGASAKAFTEQYVGVAPDGVKHFLSTPCSFLGEDNRCAVYDDRPQACRDFPYLQDRNFRSRTLMMIESCATCPIVFNVWDRLKKCFPIPAKANVKKPR
ncbi:MAG: YkgJ family cysteine cluster protein [Armatimonadetes bacterium]|nr:YkgJ family cysteine cluster protein [Armatimonadota bacterium]